MYGCYYSKIIYGFCEGNSDYVLESQWLYEQGKDVIVTGATNVVRNFMGEACYGVECSINHQTGKIEIQEDHKPIIEAFYKRFMEYNEIKPASNSDEDDETPHLGYYEVIMGDYGVCQKTYDMDE